MRPSREIETRVSYSADEVDISRFVSANDDSDTSTTKPWYSRFISCAIGEGVWSAKKMPLPLKS